MKRRRLLLTLIIVYVAGLFLLGFLSIEKDSNPITSSMANDKNKTATIEARKTNPIDTNNANEEHHKQHKGIVEPHGDLQ